MIHEILSSDVDFARAELNAERPDAEILAAFTSRGVERAKASQLLDDLQHGQVPVIQLPVVPVPPAVGAVGSRDTAGVGAAHAKRSHGKRSGRSRHRHAAFQWWFIILVVVALVALGYLLLEASKSASKSAIETDKHELPAGAGK